MSGADRFFAKLRQVDTIALDSMCFIYHFEDHPKYAPLTQILFELIGEGSVCAVTSSVTVAEIFSNKDVIADTNLAREYLALFETWSGLTVVETTIETSVEAGSIRNQYGLRLPDAMQIAAAYTAHAEFFITNDNHFSKIKNPEVLQLNKYV